MKIIFKIAQTELQKLFYSPVAWLIIVIFCFQSTLQFTSVFGAYVNDIARGYQIGNITEQIYGGTLGLFAFFSSYLYLYIPLLSMGIMSRDFSSGSIKLLYSSPITNFQIIIGKYVSLMAFGLVLIGLLSTVVFFGGIAIVNADIPTLLAGLLGIYLLICAYTAVGLFVSSLTSYMVVAAMGTLGIFALLSYVKNIGQDIEVVRDITYWFALSGRIETFIKGMITSEDVLYFLIVIGLFLSLALIKLQTGRQKNNWIIVWSKYAGVFFGAMFLGYISSMPNFKIYTDLTHTKSNTLSESSQLIVSKIPDNTTITTYTNMLSSNPYFTMPFSYKEDVDRFEDYLRFNPTIKMKYVYFYHKTDFPFLDEEYPTLTDKQRFDTLNNISDWKIDALPYSEISKDVNLKDEGFRSIRLIETPKGKKTFLRFFNDAGYVADEAEISAAFKHLVADLPTVGFLIGHGERSSSDPSDEGYQMITQDKTFRSSLINQGFNFTNVSLTKTVSESVDILVVAEQKKMLTAIEQQNLSDFVARGGNMVILGEPGRQPIMNSITKSLGVTFLPGTLVHNPTKHVATSVEMAPTNDGTAASWYLDGVLKYKTLMVMPTANALELNGNNAMGFKVMPWLKTYADSCWLELETINFKDDTVKFNLAAGEERKPYTTLAALSRKINGRNQKIIVSGDADWLSAAQLNLLRERRTANPSIIYGIFSWLSDGESPVDMRRPDPIDNSLRIGKNGWSFMSPLLRWVLPGILAVLGALIWIRRKGR